MVVVIMVMVMIGVRAMIIVIVVMHDNLMVAIPIAVVHPDASRQRNDRDGGKNQREQYSFHKRFNFSFKHAVESNAVNPSVRLRRACSLQ
jgi:hypothetical protein